MSGLLCRRFLGRLLRGRRGRRGRWNDDRRRGAARLAGGRGAAGLLRLRLRGGSDGRARGQRRYEPQSCDFVSDFPHQKLNLAITSIVRMEPALVTRPNDDEPKVAESPEKAGVFVRF